MRRLPDMPDPDAIVASALAEDLGVEPERLLALDGPDPDLLRRDATTSSLPGGSRFAGVLVAREACVVSGLPVAARAFEMLADAAGSEPVEFFPLVAEGASVTEATPVAEVGGPAAVVLAAERSALDLLAVLSGIATEAKRWVEAAPEGLTVADTRKTYPGLRALSKYASAVGGAENHRAGLFDAVLLKDNHLRLAGGPAAAVEAAKRVRPDLEVEVEADTLAQAVEAVEAGADAVLLDNMDDAALTLAVRELRLAAERRGRDVLVEASGGVTIERLGALSASGVDRVSTSAVTFARPRDFGLDEERT